MLGALGSKSLPLKSGFRNQELRMSQGFDLGLVSATMSS